MTEIRRMRHFCPGPVEVHPDVARAAVERTLCHREPEFSTLLASVERGLLDVAGVDAERFAALVITGSGTSANEAVLTSAVPTDGRILVVTNGEFGERLARIAGGYRTTSVVAHGWGAPLDLDRIRRALRAEPVDLVAMVHHETCTGALNPAAEVGAICREAEVPLFVDMVSSFAGDELALDAAGITFVTTSSGKAIAAYPGLGLVIARRRALETLPDDAGRRHYLDLRRYRDYAARHQTPNTPGVSLVLALDRALQLILEEGIAPRRLRMDALAREVRSRAERIGLERLIDDQPLSNVLTTFLVPAGLRAADVRDALRARGFVTYGGSGRLEERGLQISTLGIIDQDDVRLLFDALESVLDESGYRSARTVINRSG